MPQRKTTTLTLAMIGLFCILGAGAAGFIMPEPANSAEAAGRGIAQVLVAIAGVVLIVVYFVKRKR